MRRLASPLLVAFFVLSGCNSKPASAPLESRQADRWVSKGIPEIEGVWEYPGGEAKVMRMFFESGGQLIFKEGFEYHNPASWSFSRHLEELKLKVTIPKAYDLTTFRFQLEKQRIVAFDPAMGEIIYKFPTGTKRIDFEGWIFSKKETIEAAQPAAAPDASRR